MEEDMDLKERFKEAMCESCRVCKEELDYPPHYWWRMVRKLGGEVEAARHLLDAKQPQAGFGRLLGLDRLDLSVEAAVVDPIYASLFTDDQRKEARKRLDAVGYKATKI